MGNDSKSNGRFISFVLLDSCIWDKEQFIQDLDDEWNITVGNEGNGDTLVVDAEGMLIAVSLMPAPIPNQEAEHNAATNYLWPEAVEVTKRHLAHLVVAVLPNENTAIDAGTLLVKLCDTCLKNEHSLGVFTSGTVFEPSFYRQAAAVMHDGELPFLNWVYFGLRQSKAGLMSGYTYGLDAFGKEEIEVIDTDASPAELRAFLFDIAAYVLSYDITLRDGETIGFSAEQKLPISRSKGFNLDGMTLKIAFMPNS